MFSSVQNFRCAIPYIIWLGATSLFMTQSGASVAFGQSVGTAGEMTTDQGNQDGTGISEATGGRGEEFDGFRSSLDDQELPVRSIAARDGDDRSGERGEVFDDGADNDGSSRASDSETYDPRDRGFRGETGAARVEQPLDGDLNAQYEAATRQNEQPRDGYLGAPPVPPSGTSSREDRGANDDYIADNNAPGDNSTPPIATEGRLVPGAAGGPLFRGNSDGAPDGVLDDGEGAALSDPAGARVREQGPYEPLGLRAGSFRVYPEVTVSGAYMDNVRQTSGPKDADSALELRPSISIRSNWSRHSLEGDVSGRASFHKDFGSEDEREVSSVLRGRLDVTRRTNIEAEASYSLEQQSRGSADAPQNAVENPDVHTRRGAVALNHRFNRLRLRLRGEIEEETYDDADLAGGAVSIESDQDNRADRLSLRASYELDPGLSVFADGLVERSDYKQASQSDGIFRDSDELGFRAGIIFDNGSKIYGEVAVGYIELRPDDRRLDDIDGVTFDADLNWRPNGLTTFSLNASTEINGTTVAGSAGALTHAANFRVQHALLQHFILSAGLGFSRADYKGSRLTEKTFTAELGAEYIFNREAALVAAYEFEAFDSSAPASDYTSNQVRLGMRLRR